MGSGMALSEGDAGRDPDGAALEVALTEFRHVSSIGPMYRQLEQRLLAALGVVTAGLGSVAVAVVQPGITPTRLAAVAALATIAAWIVVLFLSLEITFTLRIMRANRYLRDVVYPTLDRLAPGHGLRWETAPALELIGRRGATGGGALARRVAALDDGARRVFITSTPAIVGLAVAASSAAVLAVVLWLAAGVVRAVGVAGVTLALAAAGVALILARWGHLANRHVDRSGRDEDGATGRRPRRRRRGA